MEIAPGKSVYMLGIGGIGMSAIARYLHRQGMQVSGYDRTETELTQALTNEGIPVYYTEDVARVQQAEQIVYTPAVKEQAEYLMAVQLGKPCYKRAQVLGQISRNSRTLAVAGTHGKTTTTSMLACLLHGGGLAPSAFVGGIMSTYGTNFLLGDSDLVVAEADEFDRSFLTLYPQVAILTSTDPDHLDIYGSHEAMRDSYRQFISQVNPQGSFIYHHLLADFVTGTHPNALGYGLDYQAGIHAENLQDGGLSWQFDYVSPAVRIPGITLHMAGQHNVENALAAITAALAVGLPSERVAPALAQYRGVKRRFEVRMHTPQLTLIDDYAHHPAELHACLSAARRIFPDRQLVVAFQPHLYTRTRDFYTGFAESLSLADAVLLTEIYPARELSIPLVTSDLIYQQIHTTYKHLIDLKSLAEMVPACVSLPAVVLTTGAGDIDTYLPALQAALARLISA